MSEYEDSFQPYYVICNNCNGSGEGMVDGSVCQTCKGYGEIKDTDDEY